MIHSKSGEPWPPAKATEQIRRRAAAADFQLWRTRHAVVRLEERSLIIGDVLHVLKTGFVHERAQESTRPGLHKYGIEGPSPNSANRRLRVIVIPHPDKNEMKVVTVMWADE